MTAPTKFRVNEAHLAEPDFADIEVFVDDRGVFSVDLDGQQSARSLHDLAKKVALLRAAGDTQRTWIDCISFQCSSNAGHLDYVRIVTQGEEDADEVNLCARWERCMISDLHILACGSDEVRGHTGRLVRFSHPGHVSTLAVRRPGVRAEDEAWMPPGCIVSTPARVATIAEIFRLEIQRNSQIFSVFSKDALELGQLIDAMSGSPIGPFFKN